jgi:hypothetical protein
MATGDMDASVPNNTLGLFWLSQQPAVIGTPNVTCYGVVVEYNQLTLRKVDGSTSLSAGGVLATAPQGYTPGTLLSLQAQWEIVGGIQTRMQVWRGNTANYSNLSRVIDYTDMSGAYVTGLWEGACCRQGAGGATLMTFTLDKLALYHKAA